jgi:hypothetical protein
VRRRLAQLAIGLGLVSTAILVLPGLALVFAYTALFLGILASVRASLRPSSLSARSIATAVFLSSAIVWPLAKPMDIDTPPSQTGTHGTMLRVLREIHRAEVSYADVNGYFDALECLLQTPCIAGVPSPPRYLSAEVMRDLQGTGFRFQFRSGDRATARGPSDPVSPSGTVAYAIVATPTAAAARGGATRAYCSDASGAIYLGEDGRLPLVDAGFCVDRSHPIP